MSKNFKYFVIMKLAQRVFLWYNHSRKTKPPPAGTDGGWGKTDGLPGALTRSFMIAFQWRFVNFHRRKDASADGIFEHRYCGRMAALGRPL